MRKPVEALLVALIVVATPSLGFGRGREGHEVVALIAEHNMTPAALERAKAILGGASLGDLHQPLHDEDNGDKGGNERHVILDGHTDNLHWVWDTGMVERSDCKPRPSWRG